MWQFSQNSYVLATRWANYDSVSMGTRCLVCFPGFECIQQMFVHQCFVFFKKSDKKVKLLSDSS